MPDDLQPQPATPTPPPSPNREFAETIAQLTARDAEQVRAREAERAEERERIARLEAKLAEVEAASKPKKYDPKDPLAGVSDEELLQIHMQGPDQETPGKYALAQDELWKRRERALEEKLRAEQDAKERQRELIEETKRQMHKEFGDDIFKEDSELRKLAEVHMRRLQSIHGRDVAWNPQAQLAAAALAQKELLQRDVAKKKEVERELNELKQKSALERGNQAMVKPSEQTRSMLKDKSIPRNQRVKAALRDAFKEMHRRNGGEG